MCLCEGPLMDRSPGSHSVTAGIEFSSKAIKKIDGLKSSSGQFGRWLRSANHTQQLYRYFCELTPHNLSTGDLLIDKNYNL